MLVRLQVQHWLLKFIRYIVKCCQGCMLSMVTDQYPWLSSEVRGNINYMRIAGNECGMLSSVALKLHYFPGPHFSTRIARNYVFRKWQQLNIIQTCRICMSAREGTSMKG
jgi:hypothetical protein